MLSGISPCGELRLRGRRGLLRRLALEALAKRAAQSINAVAFAVLLGPDPALPLAVHHGALVGVAFVATSFGINYAFARRSLTLWLIDGGYHVLQFVLYGLILGLWH